MNSYYPLTERQQQILSLTEQNEYSPAVFDGLDIDHESVYVLRASAYLASLNGWKNVPEEIARRLKAMMRCHHLQYRYTFFNAGRLFELWNRNGIHYFVLKNAALVIGGYAKDCIPPGYYCVFVLEQDWKKAYDLALLAEFKVQKETPGVLTKDLCNICKCKNARHFFGNAPEGILERSTKISAEYKNHTSVDVPIPSPTDLLYLSTGRIMKSFEEAADSNKLFYALWLDIIIRQKAGI